jgi:predicted permease
MANVSLQITAKFSSGPHTTVVTPLREELAGKTHTTVVVMLAASAALLLIGCVNLANLLMSRGAVRSREVAVRTALGAGRGRLIAQFLTESLVLASVGAAAGLALAVPVMRLLETVVPETMGPVRLTLDWRVLAFSAGVTIAAALTFGLMPALRGTRVAPSNGLRDGGRGTTSARSQWLQHALIVTQTALAVVLLTCGGLLLQTFQHLRNTDLGMQTERLLTFETPLFRYGDNEKRIAFVNAQLDAIRAIPGVVNAGATSQIPLKNMDAQATFYWLQGQTKDQVKGQVALMRTVTHEYLQTIGARLREGRFLESSDRRSESPVAVVNESFANRSFPGRSAIGAQFKYGNLGDKGYWYTIVGVVKEIHEVGMAEDLRPVVYRTHEQSDQVGALPGGIAVRTSVEPTTIVASVRQAIQALDPNMPIANVRTAEDIFGRELSTPTQSTTLLGAFAVLALLLASIGLYGVLSYAVTQRTNEIGVRMALGATPGQILWSVSRRGLALTVAGLMIGLALTPLAARLLTTLLYGFQPHYATAFGIVSLVLLVVAALACLVPARRASRVDPVAALRAD